MHCEILELAGSAASDNKEKRTSERSERVKSNEKIEEKAKARAASFFRACKKGRVIVRMKVSF
jgi:hypothetical protein